MNLFYSEEVTAKECVLGEEESKHALRVLRLSVGAKIQVTDGKGNCYDGLIDSENARNCRVEILNKLPVQNRASSKVHIAIAPTKKNNRFEWFLEKSCEIGIASITPIICEHSERRNLQLERLQKILIGAMKQSGRFILPTLNPMVAIEKFLSDRSLDSDNTFIATYAEKNKDLSELCKPGEVTLVLIGPEGDFSKKEKEMAGARGIKAINLGQTRLRTETAGIVATHTISLINRQTIKS